MGGLNNGAQDQSNITQDSSRLLLPTASKLTVTLKAKFGELASYSKVVQIGSETLISVNFTGIPVGNYSIQADATDTNNIPVFTQKSELDIGQSETPKIFRLVPVNIDNITILGDQQKTEAISAGEAITWLVPENSELLFGSKAKLTPASPDVLYFIQNLTGELLLQGSSDTAIDTKKLIPGNPYYLTIYNKPGSPVNSITYTLYHTITYKVGSSVSGTAPSDNNDYVKGSTVTILGNSGNLRGTEIRDGITQRFIGWNTKEDGSGILYSAGQTLVVPSSGLVLFPIFTTDSSVIGKTGPAGGLVFYDQGSVVNRWRYLEAAPSDQSTSAPWNSSSEITIAQRDGLGNDVGMANTMAIIQAAGAGTYAAKMCADLTLGIYSDWYLPTVLELQQMNLNLHHNSLGNFTDNVFYWSSKWSGGGNQAYNYAFYSGDTPAGNNSFQIQPLFVRAVRAFSTGGIQKYPVSYDPNGGVTGSSPIDTVGCEYGANATVLGNSGNLGKAGYYFNGWNTKADGSGIPYVRGDTFTLNSAHTTLYAQWSDAAYSLRASGPAGGLIFYENPDYSNDGWRYLEAAPADLAMAPFMAMSWTYATEIAPGTGKRNTATIIASGAVSTDGAYLCDTYSVNGYSDWYMPAKDELWLLYTNLFQWGVGGLTSGAPGYWSSSETTHYSSAYMSNFTNDVPWPNNKTVVRRIRAIRRL